jgi:hypothetical protein
MGKKPIMSHSIMIRIPGDARTMVDHRGLLLVIKTLYTCTIIDIHTIK